MSEVPAEGKDFGGALFGACYLRYFHKRRDAQYEMLKQAQSGQIKDRVNPETDMEIASRTL